MRTFNKHHVKNYKESRYITNKYKSISEEELLKLQTTDKKLQKELQFTSLLNRVATLVNRSHANDTRFYNLKKELDKVREVDQQKEYELKKENTPTPTPVLEPVQEQEYEKNYNLLFKDDISTADWTKAELEVRNNYLLELKQLEAKQGGGCSSCAKNALIRKYISKIKQLKDSNVI